MRGSPVRRATLSRAGITSSLVALGGTAGVVSLGGWMAARRVMRPAPAENRFVTPWELDIPYEEVSFRTADGLLLRGWWLENPDHRYTAITLAGHNGARHHTLGVAAALWRRGASVLLFDNRARGESEGEFLSLGYYELEDARAAVNYALSRSEGPLGVLGFSMGGSVALMLGARDRRVGAVVADSPFASQRSLIRWRVRRRLGTLAPLASAVAEKMLPYDVGEVNPVLEVGAISPRAVLLIHGTADDTTNPGDSERLYEAAGEPKELWVSEGVNHCETYFADRAAYCARVSGFFERHL